MTRDNIMTVYEVRRNLKEILDNLEVLNVHILDDCVDCVDYDNMRHSYTMLVDTFLARWTNDLM